MSAFRQIILALDRIAKGRENAATAFSGGTDFWQLADDAGDELYENTVKGADLTQMDTELQSVRFDAGYRRTWFTLHENYFSALGYSSSPLLQAYLDAVGRNRIPYEANEALYEARSVRLSPQFVFPKGTLVADGEDPSTSGMHKFGRFTATGTWTAADGALSSYVVGAAVVAINLSASQTVGATFRCYCQDGEAYKDIALSLTGASQYTQTVLGAQAVASQAAAGQDKVQVSSTADFTVGDWVLLWESDELQEIAQVKALLTSPTRLQFENNLLQTFSTSAYVWPLFTRAEYLSGGSGSGSVDLFARPDRIIQL